MFQHSRIQFELPTVILMFPQSHLDMSFELSLFRIKWFQARCQKSQLPTGNPLVLPNGKCQFADVYRILKSI